ncbi:hypothetical protein M885DRAFT_545350 [Pelagophyceae sp. CCMP2097]|nr:hypothetical protein M885DRAFT_545350 [Pelagophyceae sp. CCMP2097]
MRGPLRASALLLLRGAVSAPYIDTKVFDVAQIEGSGGLSGPRIPYDGSAGCVDTKYALQAFDGACAASEQHALQVCARLADCAAVQCLPPQDFAAAARPAYLDAAGGERGEAPATAQLRAAVARGDAATLRRLLGDASARPDVDGADAVRRRTPLMLAVSSRNVDAVRVLLAAGASTLPRDSQGLSAADFSSGNAPPGAGPAAVSVGDDARRADLAAVLEVAAHREALVRGRLDARPVTNACAETYLFRRAVAGTDDERSQADLAAALLENGVDERLCLFSSTQAQVEAPDAACVARDSRGLPLRRCTLHLFSVKTVQQTFASVPGYTAREITNAALERRTALAYRPSDAPWARHLRDVSRGGAAALSTREVRLVAIVDGEALQDCAPRCRPRNEQLYDTDDAVGSAAYNFTHGLESAGTEDYLAGVLSLDT